MIASAKSLERMANRKLRRWGIFPAVRGDAVFLCQSQKIFLPLGGFFTIMDFDSEIRIASPTEPMNDVLLTRIKRWENPTEQYQRYFDHQKKEDDYKSNQTAGEFEEVLRDIDKVQVQV